MGKNIIVFSAVIILLGISETTVASPRPMSFSGDFEQGGLIRVFGQEFGPQPAEGLRAGTQGSMDAPFFCVMVGDHPDFSKCKFGRKLELVHWSDQQIDAILNLQGMESGIDFYFFIADLNGEISTAAGPWNLNGPVPQKSHPISLVEMEDKLVPWTRAPGVPYIESWGPGGIGGGLPILSLYGENFSASLDLGAQKTGLINLPIQDQGLFMGDSPNLIGCSWIVGMEVSDWADNQLFFSLRLPEQVYKSPVYFFVVNSEKMVSNGFPLVLREVDLKSDSPLRGQGSLTNSGVELRPGIPGQPQLVR